MNPRPSGPPGRTSGEDGTHAAPPPPPPPPPRQNAPDTRARPKGGAQPQARQGGNGTGPPSPPSKPNRARGRGRTRGGARTAWNGSTGAQHRNGARCARHTTQGGGGGADATRAQAHAHAKDTREILEGQPNRTRRTHRPHGMAYQRARIRDTRTGRPATHSAGNAGRKGGNGEDTNPAPAPTPPNWPGAPRTHDQGTAPAKAVVAHRATHQPRG